MNNPLATTVQADTERSALRLIDHPRARAAREKVRLLMLKDAAVNTQEGRKGLDRALDQWLLALTMREANRDPARPRLIWNVDNTPRHWFGHTFMGAAVAVDNPDNVNREVFLDGEAAYTVQGRFPGNAPSSFSFVVEDTPEWLGGNGRNVATLMRKDIRCEADGTFRVTLDQHAANGRDNHIQLESGPLMMFTRDSFSDWSQQPVSLQIEHVSGPPSNFQGSDDAILSRIEAHLQPFTAFYIGFRHTFLNAPPPNTLVGPLGREGGWGFMAGGRFDLSDDDALVLTVASNGARYTGFQVADTWGITPDPVRHTCSLNISQAKPNPDGSYTYVLALQDPGLHNWIDPVGLHRGTFLLRWQSLPAGAGPEGLVRQVQKTTLRQLMEITPAGVPTIDLAGRRQQIAARIRGRARLHQENE